MGWAGVRAECVKGSIEIFQRRDGFSFVYINMGLMRITEDRSVVGGEVLPLSPGHCSS